MNDVNIEDKLCEAAEAFADRIDDGMRTVRQCSILAYKQGAADMASGKISSVWHDVSELPRKSEPVIVMTARRHRMKSTANCDELKYVKFCHSNNVAKWAYKDELINL